MATRTYKKPDGTEFLEVYQEWHDVLLEGITMSLGFILLGIIGLAVLPFMVIHQMFYPYNRYPEE
jgi:hypothetical protein